MEKLPLVDGGADFRGRVPYMVKPTKFTMIGHHALIAANLDMDLCAFQIPMPFLSNTHFAADAALAGHA